MIDIDFVFFEFIVEFVGMLKVSGVWFAFFINESLYLCFFRLVMMKV